MAAFAMASAVARVNVDVDRIMMPTMGGDDGAINANALNLSRLRSSTFSVRYYRNKALYVKMT